jgi:molecular chaperone HtpG
VEVVSRAAGSDQAFPWSSDARESYTIEPDQREVKGSTVVLHIKPEQ